MSNENPTADDDPGFLREQLSAFETKLSELIDMADRLKVENESLRAQQLNLVEERSRLIEKNELARVRVEAIVTRLKSLETA
ncbi:MAG: TIGR02449 family protein [Pseudomonadota bacterium]